MLYTLRRKRRLKPYCFVCFTILISLIILNWSSYSSLVLFISDWKCAAFLTVKRGGWRALSDIGSCADNLPFRNYGKPIEGKQNILSLIYRGKKAPPLVLKAWIILNCGL